MKKLIALLCALVLVFTGCALGETKSDEMTRITLQVKTMLELEDYDSFSGSFSSGRWFLSWDSDDKNAYAVCGRDGTLYEFYAYDSGSDRYVSDGIFGAEFPAYDSDALTQTAAAFLSRVITGEGFGFEAPALQSRLLSSWSVQVYGQGRLTYNALPTDITYSVSVNAKTGKTVSFSRSDCWQNVILPEDGGVSAITEKEAAAKLYPMYDMYLRYYVTDPAEMARLVYMRKDDSRALVSALDGSAVHTDLYAVAYDTAAEEAVSAKGADREYGLSEAELKGISAYEGALTEEELENILRSEELFDIGENTRVYSADYYSREDGLFAYLNLADDGQDGVTSCYTLNALTGEVTYIAAYPAEWTDDYDKNADVSACAAFADKYLAKTPYAAETRLKSVTAGMPLRDGRLTAVCEYVRTYNGYPFDDNYVTVTVDSVTGKVLGYSVQWNNGAEFFEYPSAEFIAEDTAKARVLENAPLTLMYALVSVEAEGENETRQLVLCYGFDDTEGVYAVDAETGKAYTTQTVNDNAIALEANPDMLYADEIRVLAAYGVGIAGCAYTKDEFCTPEMFMRLILSAVSNTSDDTVKAFKNRFGIVPQADENGNLTRGEAMKVLVRLAGCEAAAAIEGIYTLSAPDWNEVPAGLRGTCAICAGLGLTYTENGVRPGEPLLTAEAMHAVYALLAR